ncbi:aldo/keto reductase [Amycolatopsis sp. NPDC051903]|uniref:aldo/keto reductase n=1 Tax=Amycolatopsis sp. NPDC051903 TaxID=3363936 RepID=UPI0037A6CBC5
MTIGAIPRIRIGGTAVSRLALGGAGWSLADEPDVDGAIATMHAAIDHGVTLIDTARAYTTVDHPAHNEWLIGKALATHPDGDSVFVATKGGHFRSGPAEFPVDASPAALRRDCEQSLRTLGRDRLDLYQLHRADNPSTVLEESVGELAVLRDEGKIRGVGLCNVTVAQLEKARAITVIDAVQNRYSPLSRDDETLAYCAREGIPYLAYSPLGGRSGVRRLETGLPGLGRIAAERGCTVQQVALAWLTSFRANLVPIVGTGRPAHLVQAVEAVAAGLTAPEVERLSVALPRN